jgi:hypothetical protein
MQRAIEMIYLSHLWKIRAIKKPRHRTKVIIILSLKIFSIMLLGIRGLTN